MHIWIDQLVEKDPEAAIVLFWKAINAGDKVDSALKDMAVVMKQLDRTEEAIEAIKSFRGLCSKHSQESLDNVLLDLYKVYYKCLLNNFKNQKDAPSCTYIWSYFDSIHYLIIIVSLLSKVRKSAEMGWHT